MLGTFQKDFSQVATSKGYFPKWQLPKCVISQAATYQVCPCRSVWPPACYSLGALPSSPSQPQCSAPLLHRGLPNHWEVAAWEIAHLKVATWEILTWGRRPWENAFGKVPYTEFSFVSLQKVLKLTLYKFFYLSMKIYIYICILTSYLVSII